jgi:pyocin large subunit-like protein
MTRTLRVITGVLLAALLLMASGPGFRSRRQFDEHYAKHGAEFAAQGRTISQQEYLERAQALRDAPAGGPILEAVTPDGIVSKFDRRSGSFGAYNPDRTIRTFFIPNAGERYFRRQAQKRGAD